MRVLTVIFFVNICFANAQNLVLNSSFEKQRNNRCLPLLGGFDQSIIDWSTPNCGSTDFFSTCSDVLGSNNYNGYQKPKNGKTYAGMYVFTPENYREYVQGKLIKTLEKNKKYKMTFYLSLADQSTVSIKNIQVLFTAKEINFKNKNTCDRVLNLSKIKDKSKLFVNSNEQYFDDKENWMKYTFDFISEGYENYFTIGNFQKNNKTIRHKILNESSIEFSYYYIDDISITTEGDSKKVNKEIEIKDNFLTNQIYGFNNVLFNFDKAILLDASKDELEKLYTFLSKNKLLNIEIYGHTDNQGSEVRNNELSLQRANAVSEFLISKGIEANRIKSFGYGSTKPISNNDSEEGRAKNRRVEFKLLKTK